VNKAVTVMMTDMQGRTVYTNDFGVINNNELLVTANNLIPGNYTVSINIDGAIVTKKITVTR
ncbi:MAG: T9SS type A sorting domain-containing protein, partial [Chitinophagales bacterium]